MGDPNLAKNYRSISICNILSKIYSHILLNRLNKWAEKYKSLSKNQFRFQKGKTTTDCIFILQAIISIILDYKQKIIVFLLTKKAFDKIDRMTLWHKLILGNVSNKLVKALKSMHSVVKTCVRYNVQRPTLRIY